MDPKAQPSIDAFAHSDGRFMYAAHCAELGVGPVHELTRQEATDLWMFEGSKGRYTKARYRVKFRVPDERHRIPNQRPTRHRFHQEVDEGPEAMTEDPPIIPSIIPAITAADEKPASFRLTPHTLRLIALAMDDARADDRLATKGEVIEQAICSTYGHLDRP